MKNSLCALGTLALALAALPANAQQEENPTVTIDGTVYKISSDGASLSYGNREASGEFVIPTEVEYEGKSYPVTAVDDYAFYDWSGRKVEITSLSIPSSVTSIGQNAFGNTMITEVEIPETVKILGSAFNNCSALTSAVVKGGQEELGSVFNGCVALESAVIGEGHSVVPSMMFNGCSSLKEVTLPSSLMEIGGGMYGGGAFSGCSSLESIEIPSSVRSIGIGAFYNTGLRNVTLPEGLETLETSAFANCNQLQSVILPTSISYLPEQLFLGCSSLESIELPDNIKELRGSTWSTGCFSSCSALKEVNLGAVEILGNYTFSNCASLKEIVLPSTVVSLGDDVFYQCTSLESIEIGSSLESIGNYCFLGCDSLVKIDVAPGNIHFTTMSGILCNADKTELLLAPKNFSGSFIVPESVNSLNDYLFAGCSSLTGLVLNEGLKSIGQYVISGCENLSALMIPSSVSEISLPYAFAGNSLASFEVNEDNPFYSSYAGALCGKDGHEILRWVLETKDKIEVPEEFTVIGEGAFSAIAAEEIVLPIGLKEIKREGFMGCYRIEGIDLPESITAIGEGAFSGCSALCSVTLPEGLTDIGANAFAYCRNLNEIVLPSKLCEIPEGLCQSSGLKNIDIPETVTKIGNNAFSFCKFDKLVIPENVEEIGSLAFYTNNILKEVVSLPMTPPTISGGTFGGNVEKVIVKADAMESYKAAEYWSRMNLISFEDLYGNHVLKVECESVEWMVLVGHTTGTLTMGDEYVLSYKIKGEGISCDITMTTTNRIDESTVYHNVSVTPEWTEHRVAFTPNNSETTGIAWQLEGVSGMVLLDDVVLCKAGSTENLMENGDMEQRAQYWVPGWWCSMEDRISIIYDNDVPNSVERIDHTQGNYSEYWIVYSLDGYKVLETADLTSLNSLKPGLYIINGKKHIIR